MNAPNLTVVVNHNFTRPRGSAVGVIRSSTSPCGNWSSADCHSFRRHLDARNLFVETQDGQGCLRHDKRQNVLRTCQVRMSLGKSLKVSQSMVSIGQVQCVASLPGRRKRSPLD